MIDWLLVHKDGGLGPPVSVLKIAPKIPDFMLDIAMRMLYHISVGKPHTARRPKMTATKIHATSLTVADDGMSASLIFPGFELDVALVEERREQLERYTLRITGEHGLKIAGTGGVSFQSGKRGGTPTWLNPADDPGVLTGDTRGETGLVGMIGDWMDTGELPFIWQ